MMKLKMTNKVFLKDISINGIIAGGFCIGLSSIIPWWNTLAIIIAVQTIIWNYDRLFQKENPQIDTLEKEHENFRDFVEGEFEKYAKIIEDNDETIKEQEIVIKEYENIFDEQLVELPCVCGSNTFKGLFPQNGANEVECEGCKNKYRVTVNYDSVLIASNHNME